MEKFGKFMVITLIMIISPIINGFVLSKLWLWFIVPIFQIRQISLIEAIGLVCFISFIAAKKVKTEQDKFWQELGENVAFLIFSCIFALGGGWIITLFM